MQNAALELELRPISEREEKFDEGLHVRFLLYKDQSGISLNELARKLKRSTEAVSQYIDLRYQGDIAALEHDVRNLLRREEDLKLAANREVFCNISPSREIWSILQLCEKEHKMGAIIAPSGCSKTTTASEYVRRNPGATLITIDVTVRSLGSVLRLIAYKGRGIGYGSTNSDLLERIISDFKYSRGLLIIDEAHFLSWEAFESIRTVWDNARNSIVYLGMPRLYVQMKRDKAFLWDQILSRLAVQKSIGVVSKADVRMIADSACPGLPKNCLQFLYEKAQGPGKLRVMTELLNRAIHIHKVEGAHINLRLLKEVESLLSF